MNPSFIRRLKRGFGSLRGDSKEQLGRTPPPYLRIKGIIDDVRIYICLLPEDISHVYLPLVFKGY